MAENHECLLWHGPTTRDGKYGLVSFLNPVTGVWQNKKANRLSYILKMKDLNLYE